MNELYEESISDNVKIKYEIICGIVNSVEVLVKEDEYWENYLTLGFIMGKPSIHSSTCLPNRWFPYGADLGTAQSIAFKTLGGYPDLSNLKHYK